MSVALASSSERLLSVVPDTRIDDSPFPRPLVLGPPYDASQHGRVPAKLSRSGSHGGSGAYEVKCPPNDCGRLRIDFDLTGTGPTIAVRELASLCARAWLALCFGLSACRHSSDDHPAVICRHCMSDPVEQHRRRIAGTVAVGAVGIEHADASPSECPERIVSGVLVPRQPRPLFHQQDACAVFKTSCKCLRETGTLSHRQGAGSILEHVAHGEIPRSPVPVDDAPPFMARGVAYRSGVRAAGGRPRP